MKFEYMGEFNGRTEWGRIRAFTKGRALSKLKANGIVVHRLTEAGRRRLLVSTEELLTSFLDPSTCSGSESQQAKQTRDDLQTCPICGTKVKPDNYERHKGKCKMMHAMPQEEIDHREQELRRQRDARLKLKESQRLEREQAEQIRKERKSAGGCVTCGKTLGVFDRILGREQHKHCAVPQGRPVAKGPASGNEHKRWLRIMDNWEMIQQMDPQHIGNDPKAQRLLKGAADCEYPDIAARARTLLEVSMH
mgnify:CR=1 FL=1